MTASRARDLPELPAEIWPAFNMAVAAHAHASPGCVNRKTQTLPSTPMQTWDGRWHTWSLPCDNCGRELNFGRCEMGSGSVRVTFQ